jgi:3D (Asp-Asp-Asp) domain-containing protein
LYTTNKNNELKEINNSLNITIDEQKATIEKLEIEKNDLNIWAQELVKKNKQLEAKLNKQQTAKESQPTVATESTSSGDKNLGNFKISAYCHCSKCCGKSNGITATGTKVQANRTIAVDPKVIPLGTKVIIDGRTYIAEDTGGHIKGNRIDMYFPTHQEAINWGIKYKNVSIIL